MNKREIIISIAVSIVASCGFEIMKCTFDFFKDLPINGLFIFIVMILVCMCIILWSNLHGYKAITNKINIGGKEYYDIYEDIVYYRTHKPRNIMKIDKLKWNFGFTSNSQCNVFLDLDAEWEMAFTASQERIKKVNIGIHGGGVVSIESMNIKANQGESQVGCEGIKEQDDCTILNINLITHVEKGENDKISLKYNWENFMITDRKDDYIYLFPYSLAIGINRFELVTTHPYKCKVRVVVLRYKWGVEYSTIEINDTNNIKFKIEISEKGYAEQHRIEINEINVKNIYLVIFEKENQTEKGGCPLIGAGTDEQNQAAAC